MAFSAQYQIRNIPHLRGGLNDRYDSAEIQDFEMADAENIEVDTKTIRSAAGYVDYGGDTGPFFGGFNAKFSSGTNRMVRQRGTTLEYDNGSGVWTGCTLPIVGSPAATVELTQIGCSFAMLNDKILWSNGTDSTMQSADGITWTIPTYGSPAAELPKARVLFNNGLNRILFLAIPTEPAKVYWSAINDPLTIGATSFQVFGFNDGQGIQDAALTPNGGMLLFKDSRFYAISDVTLDTVSTEPIGDAPCVRYTVCATENSVMWAGPDGSIFELQGGTPVKISDNIVPLSLSYPYVMRAVYANGRYRLSVPSGTDAYNSIEYVVDRNLPTGNPKNPYVITKNTNKYVGCYVKEDRESSNVRRTRVYFGDGRTTPIGSPAAVPDTFAYINEVHDTGVTQGLNGSAQTCFFTTKFFTEDLPYFIKHYHKYIVSLKSNTDQIITIGYRFDPFEEFTTTNLLTEAASIDWEYDNGETGVWNEGYGWAVEALVNESKDLESPVSEARGIQFKISWSSVNDVEILSQSYKFLTNRNYI